jgi:hypothetical protein
VYEAEAYQLRGMKGFRHIWADVPPGSGLSAKHIDPFSPGYTDLFFRFARWFDDQGMERRAREGPGRRVGLDTPRNAGAALAWARAYGVLGLGYNLTYPHAVGVTGSSLREIAARQLGKPEIGDGGVRAYRKSAEGGERETVEAFVLEACEANLALKLYAAATAKTLSMPDIERHMSDELPLWRPKEYRFTEREVWAEDEESARNWALGKVTEAVNAKVERDVYPILVGEPGACEGGWGFKSLLGAMWLQMRAFVLGDESYGLCPRCNGPFYKTRRDKTYCSDECGNRSRAARGYERKKQRQQEARESIKRKLREGRSNPDARRS